MQRSTRTKISEVKWGLVATFIAGVALLGAAWFQQRIPPPRTLIEKSFSQKVGLSPDGKIIAAEFMRDEWGTSVPPSPGGWMNSDVAALHDSQTGKMKVALQAPSPNVSWLNAPTFSPDGLSVAMIYSDSELSNRTGNSQSVAGKHIALWNGATGKIIWKTRYAQPQENLSALTLQWTPDKKYILADGDKLRLMDALTGQRLKTLAVAYYQYTKCRLAPDGTRLVTIGEGTPRTGKSPYIDPGIAIVRDLSGRVLVRLPGVGTREAFWSGDGETLVQVIGEKILGWDKNARRIQWQIAAPNAYSVVLSKNGKLLAWSNCKKRDGCKGNPNDCTDASTTRLYDFDQKKTVWQNEVSGYINGIRFAPNGKSLIASVEGATNSASLKNFSHNQFLLWDSATGKVKQQTTREGQHPRLFFTPDSQRVILQTTQTLASWEIQ